MLLHRIHIRARNREARRDLADPYQLHATLCRAFSPPDTKCPPGSVLWRLEPETDSEGNPRVLVQSEAPAEWERIAIGGWLAAADPAVDVVSRLGLEELQPGRRFRFRLRANPCVTRNGKRLGLMRLPEQQDWLARKGARHGFNVSMTALASADALSPGSFDICVSHEQMLTGRQHDGNRIRIYSVLYDGFLTVTDTLAFVAGLQSGIGHGKALGLGLLSIMPAR
jgi:CRISPR system Cascade subunit CasE